MPPSGPVCLFAILSAQQVLKLSHELKKCTRGVVGKRQTSEGIEASRGSRFLIENQLLEVRHRGRGDSRDNSG
jgi:hypothetical protein